ncbi:MAG: HAMP domain-containing protein [Gammaproteobacteria bacterium]|nr:HAMP domain-containing protein [Gammaproteobacteria bacterium]
MPQSLFGRLVLVLVAGLLLAQLVGAALLLRNRAYALYQASGMQTATRIAGIVHLLDRATPTERRRLVSAFQNPTLRIRLTDAPWPKTAAGGDHEGLAGIFYTMLRHQLGEQRRIAVAIRETAVPASGNAPVMDDMRGMAMGMGMNMDMSMSPEVHMGGFGFLPPPGVAFLAQVRLRGGTWASFEQHVPREVFAGSTRLLLSLAVLLIAVVVLSLLAVRWVTRPLSVLAAAADALGRDIRRPPLPETGPREVRHAARAFNTMQARLGRYLEDRTRLLTAVSHDLKTPITRLRLRAELLDDPVLRDSYTRDLDEMQAMATATLDFLRGLDTKEAVQPVDMRALLESLKADAEETGQRVTVNGQTAAPYPGRPLALKRCLTNLINNAVTYGGVAHVTLSDDDKALRILVADEGPGIPERELERVFEPFYRLESSRSRETGGTGLGLGIARNIARAHGGDLMLRNRTGGGLEAMLTLARREPAD